MASLSVGARPAQLSQLVVQARSTSTVTSAFPAYRLCVPTLIFHLRAEDALGPSRERAYDFPMSRGLFSTVGSPSQASGH